LGWFPGWENLSRAVPFVSVTPANLIPNVKDMSPLASSSLLARRRRSPEPDSQSRCALALPHAGHLLYGNLFQDYQMIDLLNYSCQAS
jgi:hypothetical protein